MTAHLVIVILLWGLAVFRLATLRGSTAQRYLSIGLVALATGYTLDITVIADTLRDIPRLGPNVTHLIKHLTVVIAAAAILVVIQALATRKKNLGRRPRAYAFGSALAAGTGLVIFFVLAPVHREPLPDLTTDAAGQPALLAYWAVYTVYIGAVAVGIARLALRFVCTLPASALRAGMRWVAAGALLGFGYCAHKATFLGIETIRPHSYHFSGMQTVQSLLLALAVVAFVIGITVATSAQLPVVRELIAYLQWRRLHPLWRACLQAEPDIALREPGRRFTDIHLRLYRRIVEIRDAHVAVRPYAVPRLRALAVHEAQRGGHKDPELLGEAVYLEVARRAKLRGDPPATTVTGTLTGGDTVPIELSVLLSMARSWPTIQALADRLERLTCAGSNE